ncbi:binding-protein-dependent transport systems inner membrane component [Citreicella sp. SE45]|uniref:ABC transporter permease n=1 Tax=Salipiger sp. HF18 TaxID=2721557 RepID=UPI0001B8B962|nr:ABC transporter permease [Salipiger sp. HF18]EEX16831.1 binding-protein-dependent transport systems inner membrane component [Citreicella sp. SE45]MAU43872.1 ABC transporter permease [Salipiger sp.]
MIRSSDRDIRWLPGFNWITLCFFLFLYLPLIILVVFSFNATRSATVWDGFSLQWYAKAFSNDDIQNAAKNSLIIAAVSTLFSTVFATMAAIALGRNREIKHKTAFGGLLLLPLMIPEIVTAVATLTFFTAINLSWGIGNIIIAHTVFCIPFAYLPIQARLRGLDASLETAARDLYSDRRTTLQLITLPLLAPGIFSGAMLAFIISLDDFIITMMVAEAGSTTLPIYIYGLVRTGVTPEVNAVSTVLLGISVIAVLVSQWFAKKQ